MIWTGLTGGIASGKTAARKLIEGLGFPVIDADQISHKQTELNSIGYQQIVSHFGNSILNQDLSIDRSKLGQIVFRDQQQKEILEGILHPLIQAEVKKQKKQYEDDGIKLCFYDVPLLFEKQLQSNFDFVVLIWCAPHIQIQRLMNRNGFSQSEAELRIQNQISLNEKVKYADFCIDNSSDIEDLAMQLNNLVIKLLSSR